jgi:hypothetical protein
LRRSFESGFAQHIPIIGRLDTRLFPNGHFFFVGAGIVSRGKNFVYAGAYINVVFIVPMEIGLTLNNISNKNIYFLPYKPIYTYSNKYRGIIFTCFVKRQVINPLPLNRLADFYRISVSEDCFGDLMRKGKRYV